MEYKVISIAPVQNAGDSNTKSAEEFQSMLNKYKGEGWQYVRVESLKIWVNGDKGCFGIGATQGYYLEKQMVVFQK